MKFHKMFLSAFQDARVVNDVASLLHLEMRKKNV